MSNEQVLHETPRTTEGRKQRGFWFRLICSVVILVSSISAAVLFGRAKAPDKISEIPEMIQVVQLEEATEQKDGLTFSVDGVVVPYREVDMATEVAGRVVFLAENCRVGRYVSKGDILFKIDTTDYQIALDEAHQEVIQAQRQIDELDVNIENYQAQMKIVQDQLVVQNRELERVTRLSSTGAISDTDVDSTRLSTLSKQESVITLSNQIRSAESQKERLKASKKLAEIRVEKAKVDLDRCVVSAPLSGVVVSLETEENKYAQCGEVLVSIHDTSRLEVQCSLYMKHVEWLWSMNESALKRGEQDVRNFYQFEPTPVTIMYRLGESQYEWSGRLEYLDGPGLDSRTRMLPCRVMVENPLEVRCASGPDDASPSLLPGMFVHVKVAVKPRRKLLNLSEMAILPGGVVWKVLKDESGGGILAKANITTAHSDGERVLVYAVPDVLEEGDFVVTSPLASPLEGTKVRVLQ
ncbi:MAG: biotin/lipoyl-binding protein [Planctomycetia bacterium]|nr:biotin/lipoyl-binding protein [Planctomycetia bacterium]